VVLNANPPHVNVTTTSYRQPNHSTHHPSLPLFGLLLIYSQFLEIFPSKHVAMFAVFIFEMGSLVCGVAPSMNVLIFGRALAGAGAAGIFVSGMVIVAEITPLHNRAQYLALIVSCTTRKEC